MTTSDNMLVEAIRQAIDRLPIDESYAGLPPCTQDAEAALQAICIYSGLTIEVIEMIRRGGAIEREGDQVKMLDVLVTKYQERK